MISEHRMEEFFVTTLTIANNNFKHNPIAGHTYDGYVYDSEGELVIPVITDGNSKFDKTYPDAKTAINTVVHSTVVNLVGILPGKKDAMIYVFEDTDAIGWEIKSLPQPGKIYTIQKQHGELVATTEEEDLNIEIEPTCIISFVFTKEKVENRMVYVMASIHPGLPDPEADMTDLKVGDQITYEECLNRGITRIKKKQ